MDTGSGRTRSPWMVNVELPRYAPLQTERDVDVCVVGAGIAGLSTAAELASVGKSVVVIEDGATIGAGESSRTTAHLVNAFDDRYYVIGKLHGEQAARLTAQSHSAAIDAVERICSEQGIDCDFERLDGYLFAAPDDTLDELERELEACHDAGLAAVEWADRAPLEGFDTRRCLRFPRQAQFHPMRYLAALAKIVTRNRGTIHTSTHAKSIEGGKHGTSARVECDEGLVVTARDVIVATNTPVQDMLTIHTKQYPYRTYVIGAQVRPGSVTAALYWDTDTPYHYVRLKRGTDHDLLIVGGEDHKTGQDEEGVDHHERLERWARARFPQMGPVDYRWSGQVMEPMDALAYIGLNPGDENVYVVTGDSGNGMTHGVIAGILLRELILGREHPWAKLYDPSRKTLRAAADFTRENLNMAAQYGRWLTGGDVKREDEIPRGSGAVMREGTKKVCVFRDKQGHLHRFSAVCPHLGAILGWNPAESTWDCPAHGSRFKATGEVVNGPANSDLEPIDEEKKKRDVA